MNIGDSHKQVNNSGCAPALLSGSKDQTTSLTRREKFGRSIPARYSHHPKDRHEKSRVLFGYPVLISSPRGDVGIKLRTPKHVRNRRPKEGTVAAGWGRKEWECMSAGVMGCEPRRPETILAYVGGPEASRPRICAIPPILPATPRTSADSSDRIRAH